VARELIDAQLADVGVAPHHVAPGADVGVGHRRGNARHRPERQRAKGQHGLASVARR
jgi:hypothetical protein